MKSSRFSKVGFAREKKDLVYFPCFVWNSESVRKSSLSLVSERTVSEINLLVT
jgi:hypothetical protein